MKKSLGFYFAGISAIMALIGLIVFFVYTGQGGEMSALVIIASIAGILCNVSLLFGEKAYTDFTGVIAAVLLALAMITTIQGGIGNITDQVQGIVMFGKAELANMNYAMAILYAVSVVAAICACFTKKSKN